MDQEDDGESSTHRRRKRQSEEKARKEAEEQVRKEAEELAKKVAEEQAKREADESVEEGGKVYPIVTLHPIEEKEIQREALPFSRKIL